MVRTSIDWFSDHRGSAEMVYIVMAVAILLTISGVAIGFANNINESTQQELKQSEFELTKPTQFVIEYQSEQTITPDDVDKIYAVSGNGSKHAIFDVDRENNKEVNVEGEYNDSISQGDVVFNKAAAESVEGFSYGDSISFVFVTKQGNSFTAEEVYIPPKESLRGRAQSDGWVQVNENGTNIRANTTLETTEANTTS